MLNRDIIANSGMGAVNTNAAGLEISALIAEANGQAVPLGFLFMADTDGLSQTGAKSRLVKTFLEYFKRRCPNVIFTLSDKEKAEIDAITGTFDQAKHTCCYWHAIRTVEARLKEDRPPAAYNPREANRHFDFVDPTWAPGVEADEKTAKKEMESGAVRPHGRAEREEEENRACEVRVIYSSSLS